MSRFVVFFVVLLAIPLIRVLLSDDAGVRPPIRHQPPKIEHKAEIPGKTPAAVKEREQAEKDQTPKKSAKPLLPDHKIFHPNNHRRGKWRYDPPPELTEISGSGKVTGRVVPRAGEDDGGYNIKAGGKKSQLSSGTAFAVDERGYWLTARHVLDGCRRAGLQPGRGKLYEVRKVWYHPTADVALLEGPFPAASVVFADAVRRRDEGFHTGYPQSKPGDVWSQILGSTRVFRMRGDRRLTERSIVWAERERFPGFKGSLGGMSGGPVFNLAGKVIGVTTAESRRRGRIITASPQSIADVLHVAGLKPRSREKAMLAMSRGRLAAVGNEYRKSFVVARVFCLSNFKRRQPVGK